MPKTAGREQRSWYRGAQSFWVLHPPALVPLPLELSAHCWYLDDFRLLNITNRAVKNVFRAICFAHAIIIFQDKFLGSEVKVNTHFYGVRGLVWGQEQAAARWS